MVVYSNRKIFEKHIRNKLLINYSINGCYFINLTRWPLYLSLLNDKYLFLGLGNTCFKYSINITNFYLFTELRLEEILILIEVVQNAW